MKFINILTFSILTSISFLFTSCEQISSYMDKLFNSERHPSQTEKYQKLPSMAPQNDMPTKSRQRKTSSVLYYLRGNRVSLLKAKDYPDAYALSFHGVGSDVLTFTSQNGEEVSSFLPLSQILNNWNNQKPVSANLILLRNEADGIQKDVAIDIYLASPHFNAATKQLTFLVKAKNYFKTDYIGQNIGTAILLFEPGQ